MHHCLDLSGSLWDILLDFIDTDLHHDPLLLGQDYQRREVSERTATMVHACGAQHCFRFRYHWSADANGIKTQRIKAAENWTSFPLRYWFIVRTQLLKAFHALRF